MRGNSQKYQAKHWEELFTATFLPKNPSFEKVAKANCPHRIGEAHLFSYCEGGVIDR